MVAEELIQSQHWIVKSTAADDGHHHSKWLSSRAAHKFPKSVGLKMRPRRSRGE